VGLFFGDEAKGKITDLLSSDYDIVVRYSGGANAGHTVRFNDKTYKLHQLPTGYLSGKESVLANGMVLNPISLAKEIQNYKTSAPLFISDRAHAVMPWHIVCDAKQGDGIGTTKKGIGPCYADKMHRWNAIRMGDLVRKLIDAKFQNFFATDEIFHGNKLWTDYKTAADMLYPFICDTGEKLRKDVKDGRNILFEGAQGIGLDVDHGFSYPYVTSSGVGPSAIPQSCGLPNLHLDRIIGVMKCYTTRVGEGPFPGELGIINSYHLDLRFALCKEIADRIREKGNEYGTTTGRPRRIGWVDFRLLKYAIDVTGTTEIALMHADTLCGIDRIGFIDTDGELKYTPGWNTIEDPALMKYIEIIEEKSGVPVTILSYGPDRNDTKYLNL
jgi:adenylosuccinate synthase